MASVPTLKNPMRAIVDRMLRRLADEPSPPPAAPSPLTILDRYCTNSPSPQNALDIFADEWSSKLPELWCHLKAGHNPLFADERIAWGLAALGGVNGQNVLELGPLEAGHTWMIEQAGAASVTAIEANTRAFLKCLVVKELLGLHRTRFLCGDFIEYLRNASSPFDLAVASGVLYHMREPAELIGLLAQSTDRILLWTHYHQADIIRASPRLAPRFKITETSEYQGFRYRTYRQEYADGLRISGFCGGTNPFSNWMSREDIIGCLKYFGFRKLQIAFDTPMSANGPCFAIAAKHSPSA